MDIEKIKAKFDEKHTGSAIANSIDLPEITLKDSGKKEKEHQDKMQEKDVKPQQCNIDCENCGS